ncbi:MAG: hypothetical protein ABJB39_04525 [Chloroflexota bacterium]
MRDSLSREFPEALQAFAWTRARVKGGLMWGEPAVWGAISGIGAGFLVAAVTQALVGLTGDAYEAFRGSPPIALYPLITLAGTTAAAAVALRAGGAIALAFYVSYVALGVAFSIPGLLLFCERSGGPLVAGDRCAPVGFLTTLWPQLIGLGVGIAVARAITTRGDGINSLLRIAGAWAIAVFVATQLWAATVAQTATPLASVLSIAAGSAAAAVAAGVVAAQLPQGVRNAVIVTGIRLIPWAVTQLPLAFADLAPTAPADNAAVIIVSVVLTPLAAVLLVLAALITSRARFIPREPA